jgi:hypothetical protein
MFNDKNINSGVFLGIVNVVLLIFSLWYWRDFFDFNIEVIWLGSSFFIFCLSFFFIYKKKVRRAAFVTGLYSFWVFIVPWLIIASYFWYGLHHPGSWDSGAFKYL